MAAKKENKEKVSIKQFKDGGSHFWCNYAHYYLNESNELLWASGESDNSEYRTVLAAYIKRNKKTFRKREESILDKEDKVYITIDFGKYAGKKLDEIKDIDIKYLRWILKNMDFGGKEKLKEEIINILK